jgi:nitronate monooxygenase
MRALSSKPFGVNLLPAVAREGMIDACIEERPPIIVFFLGDPTPWIGKAQRSGIKVVVQVGTVDEERTAAQAGADAIIAQGLEAGGHVQATVLLATNLPAIVQAVSPLPVLWNAAVQRGRWPYH